MKKMSQTCKDCGFKEDVEIYSEEEIQKKRLNASNPFCKKCGSPRVELN